MWVIKTVNNGMSCWVIKFDYGIIMPWQKLADLLLGLRMNMASINMASYMG